MYEGIVTGALTGAVSGLGWGILNFFKNQKVSSQTFEPKRLGVTIAVYALVGVVFGIMGLTDQLGLFESATAIFTTAEMLKVVEKYLFQEKQQDVLEKIIRS